MKKLLIAVVVLTVAVFLGSSANAQGKMGANIGFDVLIPMGDFADAVNIGFGGTGQFEYNVTPMFTVTGKLGYITWSAKDVSEAASQVGGSASASFKGLPFMVGGKYYFMPAGKPRVYGQFELGLFFASATAKVDIPGVITQETSASETDFTIAPAFGVEIPVGPKGAVDISARYWGIFKDGSAHNIGARAGYKFIF
jgi:hypothetical protein